MSADAKRLKSLDAYFRAAIYLNVGQIYLKDNVLLQEALTNDHIKDRLLGHFGTSPGLAFIYAHLNRLIQDTKSRFIYIAGPGHGGPALRACAYLDKIMTKFYPELSLDITGIQKLMIEFSWPGGVPSHVSPHVPGSIHEGGELGYSLVHAYGAVFDNPDVIAACVIGDGEAETGPLNGSFQSNKFINPTRDGAVLPILHLNGYKIAGPTVMGRMEDSDLEKLFTGHGYETYFIEGDNAEEMHKKMWKCLDWAHGRIRAIQKEAKETGKVSGYRFPFIILRTPKGWTGPKVVDGQQVEGTFRSHQVPLSEVKSNPEHLTILEKWLKSYRPNELFDEFGRPTSLIEAILPEKELRMGNLAEANGGLLLKDLTLPDFKQYAIDISSPGATTGEATRELGKYLRDIFTLNQKEANFRIFCPDETASNRLNHVFEVTGRTYMGAVQDSDDHLDHEGRVMEVLSEHLCQGWLEGYLLTGRHGLFPCYEAFALIVDSMLNQHGKWLKTCQEIPWRKAISSLNYLLTSHCWRQDHNGFSHQGPGFIELVLQKKSSVARIYLPPDTNCLLSVADHCLRSKNYINLIIAGKQPMPQWLNMHDAEKHCTSGIGTWKFASTNVDHPEIVFASGGDVPTQEILAAIWHLKKDFPDIQIRMVNIVDLLTLEPHTRHPHGLSEENFVSLFGDKIPVIFAFHGHPSVIHRLIYQRGNNHRFHVRGYIEEGSTTTPFDMVVENHMSRYHLMMEALHRLPRLQAVAGDYIDGLKKKLQHHKEYIYQHGVDLPEVSEWRWS